MTGPLPSSVTWLCQVTGIRTVRKPVFFNVSIISFVVTGFPQISSEEISSPYIFPWEYASSVFPRFQPVFISFTNRKHSLSGICFASMVISGILPLSTLKPGSSCVPSSGFDASGASVPVSSSPSASSLCSPPASPVCASCAASCDAAAPVPCPPQAVSPNAVTSNMAAILFPFIMHHLLCFICRYTVPPQSYRKIISAQSFLHC